MDHVEQKDVLTTGQVARICHVAPRTVSKWFDTGKLRGYRIPGSRDRRIPRKQLEAFMRAHGIPMDALNGGLCRILLVQKQVPSAMIDSIRSLGRYDVRTADNGFQAGVVAEQFHPHVIVVDVSADVAEAVTICRNVKSSRELSTVNVVAAVQNPQQAPALQADGFDAVLAKPYTPGELFQAVERVTDLMR